MRLPRQRSTDHNAGSIYWTSQRGEKWSSSRIPAKQESCVLPQVSDQCNASLGDDPLWVLLKKENTLCKLDVIDKQSSSGVELRSLDSTEHSCHTNAIWSWFVLGSHSQKASFERFSLD